MAAVPSGYVAGTPVNGVIPLYDSTSGLIAGTMQNGQVSRLDTEGNKSTAYAFPNEIGVSSGSGSGSSTGTAAAGTPSAGGSPSYLTDSGGSGAGSTTGAGTTNSSGGAGTAGGGGNMNWDQVANQFGLASSDIAAFIQQGWDPNTFTQSVQNNNGRMPTQGPQLPEQVALAQQAKIDPVSEALRNQVATSYSDPNTAANPTAAQYQSYLDTFKQVDPNEYAARQNLGTSMDSYLKSVQDQYALGSQLDPTTARQVEQQARMGQAARGNVYGTPQMVSEAMATGQAGEQRLQQRQAALGAALGGQQSYLSAGLGLGDTAMNLYQQGLANKANAQQSALSYLGSGQTPYQVGSAYVNQANANAANAAQGGPVYQPAALGGGQLGTAQQAPQYGLDVGAQAQSYYNSLNNFGGGGAATKNRTAGALTGATSGAISGAAAGAPLAAGTYGLSIPIGAVVGGALGGASGYYS